MKIALLTVFFPKISEFINDYLDSVAQQDFKNFSLVIVTDEFKIDLSAIREKIKIPCYALNSSSKPINNRIKGLNFCKKQNFDLIICNDADDILYKNTVLNIYKFFKKNTKENLAYCSLFYKENKKIRKFSMNKKNIFLNDVINHNYRGYGALVLKKKLIPFFTECEKNKPLIFDWFFLLKYLLFYKRVKLIKDAKIFYRQHLKNNLGPKRAFNKVIVKKSIKYKENTYSNLINICIKNNFKNITVFKKKIAEQNKLYDIINDKLIGKRYLSLIKKKFSKNKKVFWFEEALYSRNLINKIYENKKTSYKKF